MVSYKFDTPERLWCAVCTSMLNVYYTGYCRLNEDVLGLDPYLIVSRSIHSSDDVDESDLLPVSFCSPKCAEDVKAWPLVRELTGKHPYYVMVSIKGGSFGTEYVLDLKSHFGFVTVHKSMVLSPQRIEMAIERALVIGLPEGPTKHIVKFTGV